MTDTTKDAAATPMWRADLLVGAAYLVALVAALVAGRAAAGHHAITVAAVADVAATAAIFAFSLALNNSSLYDAYWSVAPPLIALFYLMSSTGAAQAGADGRALLVLAAVTVWGARLTYNWRRGWHGLGHEDWRYVRFRETTGRAYWLVSATGIHLFPTVQVFLGCLPLWPALTSPGRPLGPLDALAALVTTGAIAMEWIADRQLRRFILARSSMEQLLDTGVWAWSRHPNYFGEMMFWWGLYLFGVAADPGWWWSGIGALAITAMFLFASVPMIDKRMAARRPGYAARMATVSALVPWPWPRRRPGSEPRSRPHAPRP